MSLDPSSTGLTTAPHELSYDYRTTVLYALGIGARADELDYLYEGRGPKVFPTFAVVPAYAPIFSLLSQTGGNLSAMVHGAQTVTIEKPIPPSGTFVTTAKVTGVYDMKRLAQVLCSTESRIDGDVVCRTDWQLLFRDGGGFGGPHPPKATAPKVPDGEAPAFAHEERTSPEQALLYRLSGDTNPLHADPEFARSVGFEQGSILHGLSTYGFLARAVVKHACEGDASRLRSFTAQFRKPVWPGETIRTLGWKVGAHVVVKAYAGGRDDAVVTGCHAGSCDRCRASCSRLPSFAMTGPKGADDTDAYSWAPWAVLVVLVLVGLLGFLGKLSPRATGPSAADVDVTPAPSGSARATPPGK